MNEMRNNGRTTARQQMSRRSRGEARDNGMHGDRGMRIAEIDGHKERKECARITWRWEGAAESNVIHGNREERGRVSNRFIEKRNVWR